MIQRLATGCTVGGIESQWRRDFQHPSRPIQGPFSLVCNAYRVFPQSKLAGACRVDYPPLFSFQVKERVELYLYSRSGSSWHFLGWTLHLPYCINKHFKHTKTQCTHTHTHTHSTIWNRYFKAVKFKSIVTFKELLYCKLLLRIVFSAAVPPVKVIQYPIIFDWIICDEN
jgi:hypothetical protein